MESNRRILGDVNFVTHEEYSIPFLLSAFVLLIFLAARLREAGFDPPAKM